MAVVKYRELMLVCEALGLRCKETKNCLIYQGSVNDSFRKIVIHLHSKGCDIATGLFRSYVKDLGFSSEDDFRKYLNSL